ncbi:hypothetical protein [Promicromonospora soli]
MNLDDISIESNDLDDGHCEISLTWAVEWPEEPLPPELLDGGPNGGSPARPVWVARRKAAGRLARVLVASLDDLYATRARHGCRTRYYDDPTPGCHAWASQEVLRPYTSDLDLNRRWGRDDGWGEPPAVGVTVPPGEVEKWVARLTERLEAVCADDQAMPDTGMHQVADAARSLRTDTAHTTAKEIRG